MFILPIASTSEGVSRAAQPLFDAVPWFTSSILVTIIVTIVLIVACRRATARMQIVPTGGQNLFEAIIEFLYNTFEGIVGKHMIAKCFPLLATLFIFILVANWFGLVPGVGTIGFGTMNGPFRSLGGMHHALLRPASADLNMTLALSTIFMVFWLYWTIREVGVGGFIVHTFGPKGGVKGFLLYSLILVFIFVGIIEMISIAFRPVSLSFRLYGNIFAGENLLHTMGTMGDSLPVPFNYLLSILLPLPFYFLELLVGVLQALAFTLLCAVYIQLSTSHEEEEHSHKSHEAEPH